MVDELSDGVFAERGRCGPGTEVTLDVGVAQVGRSGDTARLIATIPVCHRPMYEIAACHIDPAGRAPGTMRP